MHRRHFLNSLLTLFLNDSAMFIPFYFPIISGVADVSGRVQLQETEITLGISSRRGFNIGS